jgi:hypothetical protein
MDLKSFRHLLTPHGQKILAEAVKIEPREEDYLAHYQALSRRYPAGLSQAALEVAILRLRAAVKFPFADHLYFTREALEQASAYPIASYRARRYRDFRTVFDLACSVGGDALALAAGSHVIGLDRDPLRLAMARANLDTLGLGGQADWIFADLCDAPINLRHAQFSAAAFCDPARRADGRRMASVERYSPPLSVVAGWRAAFPSLGVKLSPGVDRAELAGYDAEIEFISLQGELKECILWFGALKKNACCATLLPGEHRLPLREGETPPSLPVAQPGAFIYEPDPAVLRAGLVGLLGDQLGAAQLDPDIAYLTADARLGTPFARSWRIIDWFPFNLKRLRAYLRSRGVGRVTVKKRGSPLEPSSLARQLRLKGESHALLFLTHLKGQPIVLIAE